jgi:hypothetical protein
METIATLILVIVGVMLFLFIVAYGIFITFYPLGKTIRGGIEAVKEYAEEKEKVRAKEGKYAQVPAAQLEMAVQEAKKVEG